MNPAEHVESVLAGSRAAIGRAITLTESTLPAHRTAARHLLAALAPHTGGAHRIGISGVPGVGKSTFVDTLGALLVERGHRVAVLAVDPSSQRTNGSILGDTTRMHRLSPLPGAYVRASPTSGDLGGVGPATRAAIAVVEAAGHDVVLVETVGVGQSETAIATMVDTFLLLGLAGTGDQLQGIKMGILEVVDAVAINKADGDRATVSRAAARELSGALRLLHAYSGKPAPFVATCSAQEGTGIAELWEHLAGRFAERTASGAVEERRREQSVSAMWSHARSSLRRLFDADVGSSALAGSLAEDVASGAMTVTEAGDLLIDTFMTGRAPAGEP